MPRFTSRWLLLRRPDGLAATVLLLGLVIAACSGIWIEQRETRSAQARFERLAERVEREVARRLQLPVYGMHGARGLFAATGQVTLPQFRAYVESRQLEQEFPGIRGFGLIERVPHEALASFVDARQREGQTDYAVQDPAPPGSPHYLIKYLEPWPPTAPPWAWTWPGTPRAARPWSRPSTPAGRCSATGWSCARMPPSPWASCCWCPSTGQAATRRPRSSGAGP